ncbi:hypothetical protein WICPIJ_003638 [Wickerhamomyces pijperi]|uniref:Major facilitator superfamily (MFS) profile domain-containing protein n=1 Tax=Wickerhamomyces pijperi TaxID=599730 RepID=A0A9P8TNP7_WICPI|nr:hypothetical protein WICPIJ_003638 [Wickerhamomyces pijperi]
MGLWIKDVDYDGEITGTFEMIPQSISAATTGVNTKADDIEGDNNLTKIQTSRTTNNNDEEPNTHLKKTKEGIVLSPQPHDNPNDPLNWPIWRRDLALFILGILCFIGGGQSSMLSAGMSSLAQEFDKSTATISYLVGGFMLSLSVGAMLASPTAILYGKRVVYLGGILIFLAGSLWEGAAKSFGMLMGGRILSGIGCSIVESLPSSTIAEIYFAHERAYRVGFYTLLLLGGKNLLPLFSALIFQNLDRHWLFWINSMVLGACLILVYVCIPETFWDRAPVPDKRSLEETKMARVVLERRHSSKPHPNAFASESHIMTLNMISEQENMSSTTAEQDLEKNEPEQTRAKTFFQLLHLFSGRHSKDEWWMVFLRPFALFAYPHILFGSFFYGLAVVWLIMISEVMTDIFAHNPYNYSKITMGLFFISPFIGGSLGSMMAGRVSDLIVRFLVKRNKGIYEPELRLWMVIPCVLTSAIGLIGFGWSAHVGDPWYAPIILYGVLAFGSSFSSTTSITFCVDSYKMFATESLVSVNIFKNVLGFLFSLFNNKFNEKHGYKTGFVTFGCIEIFVGLWAIPLYIYGKKIRRWHDQKEIMKPLYKVSSEEKQE